MKPYAVYLRVSTNNQTNDNQRIVLEQFCQSKNISYQIFEEVQSSRKTRPVKKKLLNLLRKGMFKGIIVYKLDRFARSSRELILEVNELLHREVEFISYSENIDFSSAIGKLHFNILSAFAEFERDLIRQRTMEGLRRAKSQGKTLGRPKGSKDTKPRNKTGYLLRSKRLKSAVK